MEVSEAEEIKVSSLEAKIPGAIARLIQTQR